MRRLSRSYTERWKRTGSFDLNLGDRGSYQSCYGNPPELEKGCWYAGRVVRLNDNRTSIVFHDNSDPLVVVNGCDARVNVGRLIAYEVVGFSKSSVVGEFKQLLE
jgi:hypothetical protein